MSSLCKKPTSQNWLFRPHLLLVCCRNLPLSSRIVICLLRWPTPFFSVEPIFSTSIAVTHLPLCLDDRMWDPLKMYETIVKHLMHYNLIPYLRISKVCNDLMRCLQTMQSHWSFCGNLGNDREKCLCIIFFWTAMIFPFSVTLFHNPSSCKSIHFFTIFSP